MTVRQLFKNDLTFTMGVAVFAAWVFIAVTAGWIAPYDSLAQDLAQRFPGRARPRTGTGAG